MTWRVTVHWRQKVWGVKIKDKRTANAYLRVYRRTEKEGILEQSSIVNEGTLVAKRIS